MDVVSILNKFAYHKPDDEAVKKHSEIRALFLAVALAVDTLPKCDERKLAMEHIRLGCMYANAAVALTSSPVVLDELDEQTVLNLHEMIVNADSEMSHEDMLNDIKNFVNQSGITWAL